MSKIAFFEIKDWEKKYLKKKLKDHTLEFFSEPVDKDNIKKIKNFDIISVFIYSKINKEVLSQLPKLKIICSRSTGFDHISLAECKKRKITVSNVPFYGENTVAEHTFALILSLSRNVHKSYVRSLQDNFSIDGLTGFDLKSKTLGILGGGHIGMHVARIAKGFGMKVLVYDLYKQDFISELIGFEYGSLEDVLRQSDIISLHVPYNKHTHHLINEETLKLVKKGAILINTARGGLIDTESLLDALETKKLGGVGLDVLEDEELIKEEKELLHGDSNNDKLRLVVRNKQILKMDNVVFTPHNAFNSHEALVRILDTTIENINSCNNGTCKFVVNK